MAKIKFTAKIKNGEIKIPKKYQKIIRETVTVIAEKKKFTAIRITTKDWTFDREEANQRH